MTPAAGPRRPDVFRAGAGGGGGPTHICRRRPRLDLLVSSTRARLPPALPPSPLKDNHLPVPVVPLTAGPVPDSGFLTPPNVATSAQTMVHPHPTLARGALHRCSPLLPPSLSRPVLVAVFSRGVVASSQRGAAYETLLAMAVVGAGGGGGGGGGDGEAVSTPRAGGEGDMVRL